MNIKGKDKTEVQALEAKQVLLWGLNKVESKILKKYEDDYKPTKRVYVRKESTKTKSKVRVYEPDNEDYNESDLPFLNSEYDRISKLEMTDENEDLQEKLYDVIDQIESIAKYRKSQGNGFNEDILNHLITHIVDKDEPVDKRDFKHAKDVIDVIKKQKMRGGKIEKGSPEALARAEKMRLGKEAKRIAEGKPPPKGKYVKKVRELEPYYNIGEIPDGYREATEYEAITNGKVSYWGKYEVNPDTMLEFNNVGFLFKPDLSIPESKTLIGRMITRMKGVLRDIPNIENMLENIDTKGKDSKYFKKQAEIERDADILKTRYKTASKMIDILSKHIKKSEPSFTGVIKPKKEVKVEAEMIISEKTPEIYKREVNDIRVYTKLPPKMKKSQVMDTMTWIEKTGNKVDIESKVHIKAGLNPKIKGMLKSNLNNEIDKEISGKGFKNISIDNTYNDNMNHHELIEHHLNGLMHHLDKVGIKGKGIKHAFEHLGHQIKSTGEDVNNALSKTNTYQALAKGKNMTMGDLGNSFSGDVKSGYSKTGMGMKGRIRKMSQYDSCSSDSDSEMRTMGGMGIGKGSKAMKDKMARIRAMKIK